MDLGPGGSYDDVLRVLIAGIGVGLPAVAWWLIRSARSAPLSVPSRRADPIDRWLFERHGLGVLDRWQVREAVLGQGRRPSQPRLGEAADGLAAEVLSGRLQAPRALRWLGWFLVAYGGCFFVGGIVEHGLIAVAYVLGGASMALFGVMYLVLIPRQLRRKARQALHGPRLTSSS